MTQSALPSSLHFDALFEASPNAYMVLDADLRFVTANAAYLKVTGSRLEDIVGRDVIARFPHDADDLANANARLLRASFEKVLSTGERDHLALIRYRVARSPGGPLEDRYWSATHSPILVDGKVAFILQHTTDVTDLAVLQGVNGTTRGDESLSALEASVLGRAELVQQANATLDERIDRLQHIFEQAPGFIAILRGPEHVFEVANPAYRRLIGTGRDPIGKTVREALPDIAGQGFYELLDKVYTSGETFVGRRLPVMLQTEAGVAPQSTILDFVYQPITDLSGRIAGIFVQGNDMTEQARAEDERERARVEAERANRLKDEFLATVSHELRTPLTAIMGWLDLYHASDRSPERADRAIETIGRNARALRQLVDDILDVSRIMSGKMEISVGTVKVDAAVDAAIEAVRPAAMAKSIRLQQMLDSKAMITGDAQRIQQVVWNLLANAVKFTPKGGRVQIVVERRDSAVAIVVADNGQGIAAEFLPHVFDRFRQADSSNSRVHGGLGLGLAIVKQLVELHGGTVKAESEGVGKGAAFTVLLPVALSRQSPVPDEPRPGTKLECPPELVGLRVLVVEDEDDTRELLAAILGSFGLEVVTTNSVAAAIASFEASPPELVISDIGMPEEDGYSFIRWLRGLPENKGGRIPAIALTAFARTEDRTAVLRAGFRAHIPKPLDFSELLAVIASLVPERRK